MSGTKQGGEAPENTPRNLPKHVLNTTIHGCYAYISTGFLPCRGCPETSKCEHYDPDGSCTHIKVMLDETIQQSMALPGIDPEVDAPLMVAFAREQILQSLILWRLQVKGAVVDGKDGEPRGARLLAEYGASITRLVKLAKALGITPAQRRELKQGKADLAALMAEGKKGRR